MNSYNLGYMFTANSAINITSVGYFFDPTVGFTQDHPVGIYDLSGNLLASGIVSQNTANDTASGFFEYTSLTGGSITLTPGSYIISGVTGPTDPFLFDVQDSSDPNNGLITPPQITYDQDEFAVGSDLSAFPNQSDGIPGSYFGPNFLFTPSGLPGVPEPSPSVAVLVALAVLGLLMVRRRMSQKAAGDSRFIAP
ncbi:MAG TPA: hypothetical protein VFW40_03315 [Capsulimonadaceae bacterium]|nr:hypothetical protein [Capsulimonadaceae bacterium]